MITIEVVVENDDPERTVARVRDRLQGGMGADWAGPAVSRELAKIEREWFETEGRGSWPPLAPSTMRERARLGYGAAHPILRRTNRLFNSLADPYGRGSRDAFIRMMPQALEQGTTVEYAGYHMRAYKNRPARPPVNLSSEDARRLAAVYAEFVITGDA